MHWLVKLVLLWLHNVLQLLVMVTHPVFRWLYEGRDKKVPRPTDPLLQRSATDIAAQIRKKEVSCEAVMQAFIDRIKEVNPLVNAVIAERFSDALRESRELDELLQQDQLPERLREENAPFLGIPFTAKEAFGVIGMPNSGGLLSKKSDIALKDAVVVERMRRAGAIPVGVTNCSELCMWYESSNLVYGRSNNAYHQGRITGGSSGGEACILSAAGSVIGIGSDIGGSIRMPAFFNGIFGHKPTKGTVTNAGQFPCPTSAETLEFMASGPMCRYARDLEPMFKVMLGPENASKMRLGQNVDLSKVKFYYMDDDGGSYLVTPVHPDIKAAVHKAAAYFEGVLGARVERLRLPKMKRSLTIWASRMGNSGNESFCHLMGDRETDVRPSLELLRWLCPYFRRHTLPAIGLGFVEKVQGPAAFHERQKEVAEEMKQEFQELLGDNGVFLYPTHPLPAPYHNQPLLLVPNFAYTAIFNILGLPVTQVPTGLSREGVPIGIQVVGSLHNDHLTLAVARELEKHFGGWIPPY